MLKLRILTILAIVAVAVNANLPIVNPSLDKILETKSSANIIVRMSAGTDNVLNQIAQEKFSDRGSRLTSLTNSLKAHSAESQLSVLKFLSTVQDLKFQSLWISNEIYIQSASSALIERLAQIEGIVEIREEIIAQLSSTRSRQTSSSQPTSLEPNIIKVEAYRSWDELGVSGHNAIVSSIDTGVRATHASLRSNFVGDYGWFDPPLGTLVPEDFVGQGTHSMGVMVGKYGIGVAPDAKWMACRGCDFSCQESSLTACAQFILCPTLADGSFPNCTKAPHVVNNAWWTLGGNSFFNPSISAWKAGGIVPVFTAGNDGPDCQSIRSPADSTIGVVAVSSTNNEDVISPRSSQGPSFFGQIKPDIVSPGESIISASNLDDTGYILMMGAGSGSAHVTGTIALLKSANLELNYGNVTQLLFNNTDRSATGSGMNCGGVSETEIPNNSIGWGRVNAFKSVQAAQNGNNKK